MEYEKEHYPDRHAMELSAPSDTRWLCQHQVVRTVSLTLPALLKALDFFAIAGERNRAPIARGLLAELHSNIVVYLDIMKVILGLCAGITEAL